MQPDSSRCFNSYLYHFASNLNFKYIVNKKGGSAKIAYVRDLKTKEKLYWGN